VRVLRAGGSLAAPQHRQAGAAELQPRARDRRCAADDVRRAVESLEAGGRRGQGILRLADVRHDDPAQRAPRRGAQFWEADPVVRRAVGGREELPGGGPGADPARGAWRRALPRSIRRPTAAGGARMTETIAGRRRLGRGLEALLGPTREEAEREGSLVELAIADIRPNPYQPRRDVDPPPSRGPRPPILKPGCRSPSWFAPCPG